MNKTLVVFDIDGTLTDSVHAHQNAFRSALLEIGVIGDITNLNTFKHHTDSFISKEIYEHNSDHPFPEEKKKLFESQLSEKLEAQSFQEISGASRFIEQLQQSELIEICFATGSLRRAAEHKLHSIGIEFEPWQLVASDSIIEREKIVSKAIDQSAQHHPNTTFNRIISIGDGLWDLKTAQNLNLEFIGIGRKNKEVLLENGATMILDDFIDFVLN